jgi:hypothetical protein
MIVILANVLTVKTEVVIIKNDDIKIGSIRINITGLNFDRLKSAIDSLILRDLDRGGLSP